MFKTCIALLLILHSLTAKSTIETNQKIEVLARSFPIGGFSKFSTEILKGVWGEKRGKRDILYGFIGAEANIRSSAIVNYLSGKVFLYPLPIFGFFAGKEAGYKDLDQIDTFNYFPDSDRYDFPHIRFFTYESKIKLYSIQNFEMLENLSFYFFKFPILERFLSIDMKKRFCKFSTNQFSEGITIVLRKNK